MCLENTEEIAIEKLAAWKLFHFSDYQLESAFNTSRMYVPYDVEIKKKGFIRRYPLNKKIHVIPQSATFFAFDKFEDACYVAKLGNKYWNFASNSLIVLPVILYNVIRKGYLVYDCGEKSFLSFESKEIVVYDVNDIRKEIFHTLTNDTIKLFNKKYGFQLQIMLKKEEQNA